MNFRLPWQSKLHEKEVLSFTCSRDATNKNLVQTVLEAEELFYENLLLRPKRYFLRKREILSLPWKHKKIKTIHRFTSNLLSFQDQCILRTVFLTCMKITG